MHTEREKRTRRRPPASGITLAGVLLLAKLAALLVAPQAMYFSDTATYLASAMSLIPPKDRPLGAGYFFHQVHAVSTSLSAIVVAQSLLMVASGILVFQIAKKIGLSDSLSFVAGLVASLAPTAFVYERLILSETLATTLFLGATYLAIQGSTTRSFWRFAGAGLLAACAILTRTSFLLLPAGVLLLALFAGRNWRERTSLGAAVILCASLPLGWYANYSQQKIAIRSISPWSGAALYAWTASDTDCRSPRAAPAMRATICMDGTTKKDLVAVLFTPGAVRTAIDDSAPQFQEKESQLKALAIENIERAPLKAVVRYARFSWTILGSSHDEEIAVYTGRANYLAPYIARFGFKESAHPFTHATDQRIRAALSGWYDIRGILIVGVLVALLLQFFTQTRDRRVAAVLVCLIVAFLPVPFGGPWTRYSVPLEGLQIILTLYASHSGGLAIRLLQMRTRRRPISVDG